jgi:hypothetical protein
VGKDAEEHQDNFALQVQVQAQEVVLLAQRYRVDQLPSSQVPGGAGSGAGRVVVALSQITEPQSASAGVAGTGGMRISASCPLPITRLRSAQRLSPPLPNAM